MCDIGLLTMTCFDNNMLLSYNMTSRMMFDAFV